MWHEKYVRSNLSLNVNVIMGQEYRKHLFVHLVKVILKARGTKVENQQLYKFLEFVHFLIGILKFRGTKEGQQQFFQFLKCIMDVCLPAEEAVSPEI